MSTKSRQTIYAGPIMGAKIRAEGARKRATEAAREADRAEAEAWSLQMEAYGGPAQPSPTIGNASTAVSASLRTNAISVRPAPAFLLPSSALRAKRRSGNLRPH